MIPLRDHNRPQRFPLFTYGIIALNVAIYVYQATLPQPEEERLIQSLGLKPALVVGYVRGQKEVVAPEIRRDPFGRPVIVETVERVSFWNAIFPFLASMFLHGGIGHLLGNMWFLHIFGDNVEDRMGRLRFLFFYLASGLAASLAQILVSPNSGIPCVGASGAISGVLGAYAVMYPRARVLSLVPLGIIFSMVEIPAFLFLIIWFGIQVLSSLASSPGEGGVAWWAHIGGFVVGLVAGKLLAARPPPSDRWRQARDVPFSYDR